MNVSKEKEEEDEMGSDLTKVEFVGFIFFAIVNVVCNILVCIVIRRSRRVQSTTNYFVASLSIADVLFSVLVMSFVTGDILAGGSRCYRSNTYAITIAPSFGKKNFVGVMPPDNGRASPIRAFDRSTHCDPNPWGNNNSVTSYI
uniref:G-protein coupled receptors family 1 profile domain-containing protein n=1 Tax=Magallana gigas TaxID=29159 RepID=A0A8W8N3P9_MAGGI